MKSRGEGEKMQIASEAEIISILTSLVRIPSENPPGLEKECTEYIVQQLGHWGIDVEVICEPFEQRPQAVAIYGTGQNPILILNGHVDVVPAGDRDAWTVDPYAGIVKEGKLFGRGAADMKGGLTAAMLTLKTLKETNFRLKGTLMVQFAVGEETAEPGTRRLLEKGFTGNWAIVLEPTGLQVATSVKGLAWYKINVRGQPCHASRPWLGRNAIIKACEIIHAIHSYNRLLSARRHPLLDRAHATVTMINGGDKENVIPGTCDFVVDRRILPNERIGNVDDEICKILQTTVKLEEGFSASWQRYRYYQPAEIPVESRVAEVVRKYSKEIAGVPEKAFGMLAATDARNFINDAGVPAITWGPGNLEQAHTYDEYIELRQIQVAVKILLEVIEELLA